MKKRLVDIAEATGKLEFLEADFVMLANDILHLTEEEVRDELGTADAREVFSRWDKWLRGKL